MRRKGTIADWNDAKGYGFIAPNSGGKALFVHVSAFANRARRPQVGEVVTYGVSADKRGRPCAVTATLAGDSLQAPSKLRSGRFSVLLALTFLAVAGGLAYLEKLPIAVALLYLALSLMTFVVYAWDKSAARRGGWRTQESTLHLFALAGGWPGALLAQQSLRHKSQKESFRLVFWMTVVMNLIGFAWLFTPSGTALLDSLVAGTSWS